MKYKFCPYCRQELKNTDFKFCPFCGKTLDEEPSASQEQPQQKQAEDALFGFSAEDIAGLDRSFGKQLAEQEAQAAALGKELSRARVFCIRGKYGDARKIYESLLDADPENIRAYIGLVRVETENFSRFEGANIDEAIRIAEQIARGEDLSDYDEDFADYAARRRQFFSEKEQERHRRKLAEDAKQLEEKIKKDFELWKGKKNIWLKKYKGTDSDVVIPDCVTCIDGDAFDECSGVTGITFPAGVTYISPWVFSDCPDIAKLSVDKLNKKYYSENNCIIDRENKTLVLGCKNSIIPEDGSVTSIGVYAFHFCRGLKSIRIPRSVRSIGDNAFQSCSSLESVQLCNGLKRLGESAFEGCSNLKHIELPKTLRKICAYALSDIAAMHVNIPADVTTIGRFAFEGSKLTYAEIPPNIHILSPYVFNCCDELIKVKLPDSLEKISYCAFDGCKKLTDIRIPKSVREIGNGAFGSCERLKSVTIAKECMLGEDVFPAGCNVIRKS